MEPLPPPPSVAKPAPATPSASVEKSPEKVSVGISGDWLDKETQKITTAVSKDFKKELDTLYKNIQNDRIVQDTTATARQEGVIRIISASLSSNIEKTVGREISNQIQNAVLPTLNTITTNAVASSVGDGLRNALHHLMPRELNTHLPAAIHAAMSDPQLAHMMSESVSVKLVKQTEKLMSDITNKQIIPNFKNIAVAAAADAAGRVEARMSAELRTLEAERRRDASRVEKLASIMQGMSETLRTISQTQMAVQGQVSDNHMQLALRNGSPQASGAPSPYHGPIARPKAVQPKTQEELNQEVMENLMREGKYEDACIKWLHTSSDEQIALFDKLFIKYNSAFLQGLSNLLAFSIAISVGGSLQNNTVVRLDWILTALNTVDLGDHEIGELASHAPGLLTTLIGRLEGLYMTMAETNIDNPILRRIPPVAKKARELKASMNSSNE